ncbi:RagB/SusD family nutrient uptake outer membrane protein [Rufibacter tibetensis]|uniref:Carbohydrate-binding protein SusD n=1 Tax=Rufibacter tibetensis TaxID=512763 RepID=A0A0P0CXG3_9BACT|nr:RagB/SusD family nutrient uptake outer membrane protein [Rufibacter tibetensis]ALJ00087.1 carbohydrate-binding protein SusD [Rufibacter tibetensis]
MKKNIIKSFIIPLAFGGLVTISSCENYLEVENPSTLSQNAIFNSIGYTESAITGVYNMLPGDNGYGSRLSHLLPNGSDDFRMSGDHDPIQRGGIAHFGVSPGYTELQGPFNQLYIGIERANICIKYIPLSPLYTSGTAAEQATMRRFLGEALTLRAQYYHELIRNWGDVPAHFEPSADMPDLYLPKTNQDEIYDRLLADLKQASELVPWRSESGSPTTRVTKGAVKGLRARIALARGGYALRRDSKVVERRSNYKEFYQIARDETRDVIQSRQHGLNPSFDNVFKSLHGAGVTDVANEHVWQVGAFGGNARTDTKLGFGNGPRIAEASTYGRANGLVEAVPTYFYAFDSIGDSRRDVTLAYFQVDTKANNDNKLLTTPLLIRDGKFRKYWTNVAGTNQTLGINWPLIRYADILLMFAEAENELNGPTPEAKAALEEVRKRAFFDEWETRMPATPSSKDEFFKAIVNERYLEFGGEGFRKYDLIRWNLLETRILQVRADLRAMMTGTGRYANVPQYVFFRPTPLLGRNVTARQEMLSFDLLGGNVNKVMYTPSTTTVAPDGYTRVSWRIAVTEAHITGPTRGFASQFKKNQSELLPIFNGIIAQNYRLTQDYGY